MPYILKNIFLFYLFLFLYFIIKRYCKVEIKVKNSVKQKILSPKHH